MPDRLARRYALIPAAGAGTRMGSTVPKQYELLAGRALVDRTLDAFRACAAIDATFVVLAPDDTRFVWASETVVPLYVGGATRRDSVLAGLDAIADRAASDDWVLVHDAARPGLDLATLVHLIDTLDDDPVGGLLALPVADTLKRASSDERVDATLPRESVWAAQTPQMFRYASLRAALVQCATATDEASAIEALGQRPRLVRGTGRNFKITYRDDLALAEALWAAR